MQRNFGNKKHYGCLKWKILQELNFAEDPQNCEIREL